MLHKGRIIAAGTPEEIQQHPDPVVQRFIKGEPDFLED
jgi:phospholipid/cholesterol/gamma-HCH transport system ATP-binding protein